LAHAAGNAPLSLHDWGVDFACWCTYKYINSGPGSLGGVFVHEKHTGSGSKLEHLQGWWGHDSASRFQMLDDFIPAEAPSRIDSNREPSGFPG
jgi:kynureninase